MADKTYDEPFAENPEDFFADYTDRDWEVVDYQFYFMDALPKIGLRGPAPDAGVLASGEFCTAVGAAQTLGVYVVEPFTQLLQANTGLPCLNLGLGGGNPAFFAKQPALIELINRGKFCILQVMTARAQKNSRMEPVGIDYVRDLSTGRISLSAPVWMKLLKEEPESLPGIIEENRADWRNAYRELIDRINVPVLLFHFSIKPDDEPLNLHAETLEALYGTFPQFVDRASIDAVAAMCDGLVEARARINLPHPLISRFTGEPVAVDWGNLHPEFKGQLESENTYYPSPEMHLEAARLLEADLRRRGWIRGDSKQR